MINTSVNLIKVLASDGYKNIFGNRGGFKFLKDNTAQVFPNVIDPDLCAALRSVIDETIDKNEIGRIWHDAVGSDTRILQFERDIPKLVENFDIEGCISNIDAFLGIRTKSWMLMANRLIPKSGNIGSGGGYHRDSPFSHQIKCIWYLDDVTTKNGPFSYIDGTNRDLIGQRSTYPLGQYRFDNISDNITEVTAPAGSLLVCDTRCIHGGRPILKGSRYAVTLYTFPDRNGLKRMFTKSGLDPEIAADRSH